MVRFTCRYIQTKLISHNHIQQRKDCPTRRYYRYKKAFKQIESAGARHLLRIYKGRKQEQPIMI